MTHPLALSTAPNEQQLEAAKENMKREIEKLTNRPPQLAVHPGHSHIEVNTGADGKPIVTERRNASVSVQMPDPRLVNTPFGTQMPKYAARQMGWLDSNDQWIGPGGQPQPQQVLLQTGSQEVGNEATKQGEQQASENTYAMNATADLFAETVEAHGLDAATNALHQAAATGDSYG